METSAAVRIGVDEAGKGDYFGYLVVAAVAVDKEKEKKLKELKIRDSKKMFDSTVRRKATQIKKICEHEIIRISPEKYNVLHKKFGNLNKLLAWAHARAIENLLKKTEAKHVISDKFEDRDLVKKALFDKGKKVNFIQKVRAEEDLAVAAASVVARAEFLNTLRQLSLMIGYKLPKGATHVEDAARQMVKRHGKDILEKIAKTHFRTTKRVLKK